MAKENVNAKAKKVTNAKAEMPTIKVSEVDEIFRLVKDKEGVKITCGNYLISKKVFKSFNKAEEYIAKKPYEIIINCTCLFAEMHMKDQKQEQK